MTDSNLISKEENTVPAGAFGIGSKATDDFTEQYKDTESFLDWDQTVNKEDAINNSYFANESFKYVDEDTDNNNNILRETAGLGVEVGAGIGTDFLTAPLLASPDPFTKAAYFTINFGSGFGSNVAAQKTRGETDIDYGEAIRAGLIQMIPFGSTGKGFKGFLGAGIQGASTATGETTLRTLMDEKRLPTLEEVGTSATIGTTFGVGFKGSLEGLDKIFTKYSGKSADEINKIITPTEINQINKVVKQANDFNTTGIDAAQSTKVDNIFKKYDEKTRDRIDDALGLRRRVKPFKTNLEAGRGLRGSQGADELKKRLQLETNFKRANPEEVKSVQQFIDIIGDDMFSDVSLSLSNKIGAAGQFDFASSLITIRRKVVEGFEQGTGGGLDHVAVHELWHSLSRYLPKEDLVRYKKEFATAQTKYLKQFDKERSKFIRTTSKEELANLIYQRSDDLFARKPNITDKNFLKKANAYFERGKFTNENYRFKNIDEFFAENLADEFFNALEVGGRLDLAPTGTFKRISQEVSIFLQDLFDNLRAKLGGPNTKKIFSDFVKRKNVKKYRRFALDQTNVDKVVEAPKKPKDKGKNIGDPKFTPNQINPEQVSNTNKQFDLIVNRVNELTDQGAFRGVKTFEDTIDGGIKLLANKKKLKRYAKTYAKLYGLQPTDELNYALAESVTFSVRKTSEINQDLISAINVSKDSQLIETKINELVDSIAEIDDWLRLSIPLRTEAGTALSAMRIPTQGLSAEEFAELTPQGKYKLQNTGQTELSLDVSDQSLKLQDLKRNLLSALDTAKETGDYSAINKLTNTIKQSQMMGDSVETLSALYRSGILDRGLSSFNKGMRIFNEIGINALLSAPGTNEVNFVSGILETYTSAFELALGAGSRTELDAAIRHFMALHSNLSFSTKAFKKSWEMSENYVNRGSLKADYQERFVISSDDPGFVGKNINRAGKIIRLPSQLMTSVDALVQSPNLIGHIHYQGHIEGVQLGKKGKDLDNYVKGHVDAILEYYASNSGKAIKDPVTARILKRSQEFAKRSTFTEDIRTDGYIGFSEGAKILNQAANKIPLVRGVMAFVRTPTNIMKRQLRRTPALSYLQKQLQNDLQSVDPGVRNQARGQVRLANGLGLTLFTLGAASWVKPRDPNNPAGLILTGGGPDWKTKEGRAIWKNLRRNGWQPYSVGHLQKNEDGTPKFGEDGKPVYKYTSYERVDPLSTWIGLMVDFSHIAPWLKPDEYDEFTAGFVTAFSRNLIDRSYTRQIYEASQLFYDETKREDFLARQLAARTPYANFIRYAKRMPDDILGALGVSEKDREYFNTKRDLKARKGDVVDEEGEEIVGATALRKLLNQYSETVPGMGGNLPLMKEHITDEPMLYPERVGPDLFSFVKKSTSKNNPIYSALIETGIQIREPSDVITGKATDSQIEPFKLTTTEYSELRKEINTIIPESQEYGNRNIKQAMTAFINSSFYKDNIKVIRKNGILNSPVAVNLLTKEFNKINNYYINEGEDAWIRKQPADTRNKQRNKKLEIYNKYNDEIQKIRALSSN